MTGWNCSNYGHTYKLLAPHLCLWCNQPKPKEEEK